MAAVARGILALVIVLTVTPERAYADDAWRFKIVAKLVQIQSRQSCFTTPKTERYIHILGVQPNDVKLTRDRQAQLINNLNETILANTTNRVTVARQFQSIATQSTSMSEAQIRKIQALEAEARNAEITVLLQPVSLTRNQLNLQVTIWVTDAERAEANKISCVTSFSTAVTFEDDADPICLRAWRQADLRDDIVGYEGFINFFPDCAEAIEARRRITAKRKVEVEAKKSKRCKGAFAVAQTSGTLRAFEGFVRDHHDCPQLVGARAAIEALKRISGDGGSRAPAPAAPSNGTRQTAPVRHAARPRSSRERCARSSSTGLYCASSVLPTQGINSRHYGPRSLFDGSNKTAWVEGRSGYGEGEWVLIKFDSRTAVSGLFLKNGYPRKAGHFQKNSAVRDIDIRLSNGRTYRRKAANHPRDQWFSFPPSKVDWVQVVIRSVRRGSRWADTAINELRPVYP